MDTITVCEDQGIITTSKGSFYSQCLIFLQLHILWLWDKWVLGEKGAHNWEEEKETERVQGETHPKSADVDCRDSLPRVYGQGLCMVGISRRPEVTQLRVSFRALLKWPVLKNPLQPCFLKWHFPHHFLILYPQGVFLMSHQPIWSSSTYLFPCWMSVSPNLMLILAK